MNNLKKIGLTALGTSLIASSAYAGALSVTGSASITFSGNDSGTGGNTWSMSDSVTFSGSGVLDNGFNVTVSYELDSSETGTGNMDSRSVKIDTDGMGVITFAGHGGSSATTSIDASVAGDIWDGFDGAAAVAVGVTGAALKDSGPGDNSILYTLPSMMDGLSVFASLNPQESAVNETETGYGLTYTGVEGLTIGYAQGDVEATTNTKSDENTMYAKYAMGGITVGIQVSEADFETGTDYESTSMGISYQVNDDLSVSYGAQDMEAVGSSNPDQETSAVSVSYTMGSLSIGASVHNGDSIGNTAGNDREAYNLSSVSYTHLTLPTKA